MIVLVVSIDLLGCYIVCHLHLIPFSQLTIDFYWIQIYYLLSCKSFMLKEFWSKLRYMSRSIVVHKYLFHCEIVKLGLFRAKKVLSFNDNTVQFNSFINFEWSNNDWLTIPALIITLQPPDCLLLAIGTYESIRSIKYHWRFIPENYFRKVNFHVFIGTILML